MLAALVLTVWLAGPRAFWIIAARVRLDAAAGPPVEVGRVGYLALPDWLEPPALLAVMEDLEPRLGGAGAIMDEALAVGLMSGLRSSPWVRDVSLERAFPDRFRLSLTLRRPVLEVHHQEAGRLVALVDGEGVCLPPVPGLGLPRTVLAGPLRHPAPAVSLPHPDAGVLAAAQVAVEWRDLVVPAVPGGPPLVEVDGSNVDYRYLADGRHPEVQVLLQAADGGLVPLAWGHHPASRYAPLPVGVKVGVLKKILAAHPGLLGITGGDLRFENRWEQYLRPYRGAGPWGEPDR